MFGLSVFEYIHMNILFKNNEKVTFHPLRGTYIHVDKSTKIYGNGVLFMNTGRLPHAKMYMYLQTEKEAEIHVEGNCHISYGCDIKVFSGGKLELNDCSVNSYSQIRCKHHVKIGKGTRISRNVQIWDDDHHKIIGQKSVNNEVFIGDNVWIGAGATILKGVHISEGAVVAAGAVVTKDVPKGCLVAGVPAKVIKENVEWQY